ncbi:pyridoxamine 5'-phosphate oxidase family protein [Natrarchaeobaculum aegyptiacum]|uniref:Flavin-nucleotide-binding protein n=1 Tax=Natrarchaeobaculum aegyptiacum TaxID=745377 RepID=A0A2Z2HW60_9EURY|nr:pyridoxamine 5'-phosphate oxidase family protein [Natrarchaeobaculum aegyptiacum]ARS91043.1 flavin-nucleotide-binding protein [Natrarchaeobaculum aegyptiacum]
MRGLRWVTLPEDERNAFLGDGGTGVLSFGAGEGEPPRSLPVSYGYAAEIEQFYFKLSFPPASSKDEVIDNPVSFVVFGPVSSEAEDEKESVEGSDRAERENGHQWKSVVATGRLEELTDLPSESAAVQGLWAVDIPGFEVFEKPREDVEFQDFCLDPESITGRKEAI